MTEHLTVRGFVGGDIRLITTEKGLPIASFRVGSTPRRLNRETGEWENGETNWYSVTCFRQLATNVHAAVRKGDPVVVSGRLRIRPWENQAGQRGTSVEVDADGVGHDLTFGTGSFMRLNQPAPASNQAAPRNSSGESPGPDADWGPGGVTGSAPESTAAEQPAEQPDNEPVSADPAWDEADQKEPAF